ncbi:unnamed protein product [Rhizophagus irregularis]|nr:unnamed protein product [Rhizophagus irregularis]CAB5372457.1 unnamed protein product [Rhizophagus irregularis]
MSTSSQNKNVVRHINIDFSSNTYHGFKYCNDYQVNSDHYEDYLPCNDITTPFMKKFHVAKIKKSGLRI